MSRSTRRFRHQRHALRRSLVALAATGLAGVGLALAVTPTTTSADEPIEPVFVAEKQKSFEGGSLIGSLPDCGPRNINGRGESNYAEWTVYSTLAPDTEVNPGDSWMVRLEVYGYQTNNGNNGPDPLKLKLHYTGPAEVTDTVGAQPTGYVANFGKGSFGSIGQLSATEWAFDANTNPGVAITGDGAFVQMDVTLRATAKGVVNLDRMQVSGYDGTPKAGNFSCDFPVHWDFPVDTLDPPTSGADAARTDASYSANTIDDANGGAHSIQIPVLANDNDPEVPGGPGNPAEVRIKDWQPGSVLGGTVSCGTAQQKGNATFASMSAGPCTYTPPQNTAVGQNDSFGYVLRSVSGLERSVEVSIDLADNTPPTGGDQEVGVGPNAAVQFQLTPTDAQGDPVSCVADPVLGVAPNGDAGIDSNCKVTWGANALPGLKTFTYRACDKHDLLQNGDLGSIGLVSVSRAAGYFQGSPSDLDPDLSSRCANFDVNVNVQTGVQIPPNAGSDSDTVDSGYATGGPGGSVIGAYTVEIPVLANDVDNNGVQPSDPAWNGVVQIISGPTPGSGTASVNAVEEVVFTPADGYEGPVSLTYRVCEDPAQQNPVYVDDPDTFPNEGLPLCGVGKVSILVVGNDAPIAEPDAVIVASDATVDGFDVSLNDFDSEGQTLECTPGPLAATPAGLVASASIDAQCLVDLTPVAGASGAANLTYELCDVHALLAPGNPASPYGADGREPGDLANRCSSGVLTASIVAPVVPQPPDPDNPDPDPVCMADEAVTIAGKAVDIAVLANDTDTDLGGDPSELSLDTAGIDGEEGVTEAGGSLLVGDGIVTYSPPGGFTGTDSFQYSAIDSEGQFCSVEVQVEVKAAPVGTTTPVDTTTPTGPTTPSTVPRTNSGPHGNGGTGRNGDSGNGALPRTGANGVAPLATIALSLLAVGGGFVLVSRTSRLRRARR